MGWGVCGGGQVRLVVVVVGGVGPTPLASRWRLWPLSAGSCFSGSAWFFSPVFALSAPAGLPSAPERLPPAPEFVPTALRTASPTTQQKSIIHARCWATSTAPRVYAGHRLGEIDEMGPSVEYCLLPVEYCLLPLRCWRFPGVGLPPPGGPRWGGRGKRHRRALRSPPEGTGGRRSHDTSKRQEGGLWLRPTTLSRRQTPRDPPHPPTPPPIQPRRRGPTQQKSRRFHSKRAQQAAFCQPCGRSTCVGPSEHHSWTLRQQRE